MGVKKNTSRTKRGYTEKRALWGWIFVLPFLVGIFGFYGKVWIDSVIYSMSDLIIGANGITLEGNGFSNYHYALMKNTQFLPALLDSLKNLLVEVPLLLIFSLFIAVLLNNKMRG